MSNNKDLTLEDNIISYLRDRRSGYTTTRKDIQNQHKDYANKKDVKHALKRLVKLRVIEKDGKSYAYNIKNSNTSEQNDTAVPIGQSIPTEDDEQQIIKSHDNEDDIKLPKNMDLDEEIARLEAELAADNSDSDDDDISDEDIQDSECNDDAEDDAPNNNKKTISFGQDSVHEYAVQSKSQTQDHVHDKDSDGIICLSNLANDRIEPLPQSALPQNKRKVLKGIDKDDGIDEESMSKKRKKQRRQQDEEHTVSEGLKSAVQDLLQNYVRPSQLDRPPFYCRVCQHQSKSQSEFDAHRQSEFHTVAVKEEKKRTYCKLCRKQLTSVIQMEEHLKSKPHRDRMDYMKGKQRGLIGGGNRLSDGGGRGRGTGSSWQSNGKGRGTRNDSSGRQWC